MRKKIKETDTNVTTSTWEEEPRSSTFQEFRDKWEPKLYKWESILQELKEAQMLQSDLEGEKDINVSDPMKNIKKMVEQEENVVTMADVSRKNQ